jgi:rhodanese-related sulfurtransferase
VVPSGRGRYREVVSDTQTPIPEVTPDEAEELLGTGALLLDVREDDEWAAGHAPAAFHIPMGEVDGRTSELDVDQQVVAVCRAGARSLKVANLLAGQGFDVVNLTGGMQAWEGSGRPVVVDGGGTGQVI